MDNSEKVESEKQLALGCWYVSGATASGKTEVGVRLAQRLNAEIISLDSMAIYRGMDIGTAKPNRQQQQGVPHHLIDIVDPDTDFSLSQYRTRALATIEEIRGRGREVVFVGGTALYLKALLRGIFEGPPADWAFREEIEREVERVGVEALHRRLQLVDPLAAHKLHPQDQRRIIRALEVHRLTGQPISHWQKEFEFGIDSSRCRVFAIRHPRPVLHERIAARVAEMFDEGFVDECRRLLEAPRPLSRTALQAVGYREVFEQLRGEADEATTIERVLARTRQFARHQETWFRNLTECRMIDVDDDESLEDLTIRIHNLGIQVDLARSQG